MQEEGLDTVTFKNWPLPEYGKDQILDLWNQVFKLSIKNPKHEVLWFGWVNM